MFTSKLELSDDENIVKISGFKVGTFYILGGV